MAFSRYTRSRKLNLGTKVGTTEISRIIRNAVNNGQINVDVHMLQEGERLDTIAGEAYGDGRYWWIIAAASGIGWGLQVPPGTRILIPTNISQIEGIIA